MGTTTQSRERKGVPSVTGCVESTGEEKFLQGCWCHSPKQDSPEESYISTNLNIDNLGVSF